VFPEELSGRHQNLKAKRKRSLAGGKGERGDTIIGEGQNSSSGEGKWSPGGGLAGGGKSDMQKEKRGEKKRKAKTPQKNKRGEK